MTKEEQIKEIANLMAETMLKNFGLRFKDFAEVLYNAGYRKTFIRCAATNGKKCPDGLTCKECQLKWLKDEHKESDNDKQTMA